MACTAGLPGRLEDTAGLESFPGNWPFFSELLASLQCPIKTLPLRMDASLVQGRRGGGKHRGKTNTGHNVREEAPEELGRRFSCTDWAVPSAQR